jgi:TrmH family RNA methyltransferase
VAHVVSAPERDATKAELRRLERLHRGAERRELGQCLVEGAVLLADALAAGLVPELVAVEDALDEAGWAVVDQARDRGATIVHVDARTAGRLSGREHAVGLLAAVPTPTPWNPGNPGHSAEPGSALSPTGPALVVVLAGLQDPGNVGTLLRSALAFRAAAVLVTPGTADPFGPKVIRASAGAALRLPSAAMPLDAVVTWAGSVDLEPVAAVAPPTSGGGDASLPERCLLVLGHETRGLPDLPGARPVTVAHDPAIESLNVAMAGSILMASWYGAQSP